MAVADVASRGCIRVWETKVYRVEIDISSLDYYLKIEGMQP